MAALESQIIEGLDISALDDYQFTGDEVTQVKKRDFIEALRTKATVYHAAQVARISRKTAYQWYDRDPQFAQAWEDSFEDAADVMESSVYERALGTETQKGDSLLAMFWLKAHRKKFRDKVSIDVDSVVSEIRERLNSLNLKQLPASASEFIPTTEVSVSEHSEFQPFPPDPRKEQKEEQ